MRKRAVPIVLLAAVVAVAVWYFRHRGGPEYYTGFVEGEERVIRSEVTGRVLEVPFAEGDRVEADGIVARLDDADVRTRLEAKRQEVAVAGAEVERQREQIGLIESTWQQDVSASGASLRQAESAATLASRSFVREQELAKTGASTAQLLDDARAKRDQAKSGLDRAREMSAKAQADARSITVAERELATLRERHTLVEAQLAELRVTAAKYAIRAPAVPTVVQTQHIWPGELAQPGVAVLSVLDPRDKYVQLYVPVADVAQFTLGRKVAIELDSRPGTRTPGEVSFVAEEASFTPEKIETRDDRLGQVYRVKVRILEDVERFQPGTEGNVYLEASSA